VSASAANAWRRSFFVPVEAMPPLKKECGSIETDVDGKNTAQKAIRELSPEWLAANGRVR